MTTREQASTNAKSEKFLQHGLASRKDDRVVKVCDSSDYCFLASKTARFLMGLARGGSNPPPFMIIFVQGTPCNRAVFEGLRDRKAHLSLLFCPFGYLASKVFKADSYESHGSCSPPGDESVIEFYVRLLLKNYYAKLFNKLKP
jgi:hypothetical protein